MSIRHRADENMLRSMRATSPALQEWWPVDESPRSWKGVTWTSDDRVQVLKFYDSKLEALSPEIGQLLALTTLVLWECKQLTLAPGVVRGLGSGFLCLSVCLSVCQDGTAAAPSSIVAAYAPLLIVEPHKDTPNQLHAFLLANPLAVPPFFKSILTDAARANWLHEAVKATPSLAGLTDTDGRRAIDVAYSVCTQAMQAAFFLICGRSDGLYVPELLVPPLIEEDLWTAYLAAQDDPAFTALLA
eukprot:scaffold11271_cov63-Phaeocystis_antarctica.AAC.6